MSDSSDPSMTDSETLKRSLHNDLKEAGYALAREDLVTVKRRLAEAQITINELLRREERKSRP